MGNRPGVEPTKRELHVIFICDYSGSMEGEKIQALNSGVNEVIPAMKDLAQANPNVKFLVRAIKFGEGATWHIANPTPVDEFQWTDLSANGRTDMGKALSMVADQLKVPPMVEKGYPPALILMSDGIPTDNFDEGLENLMNTIWGKKSSRIAIAIGKDADRKVLQKFIGNPEFKPLEANDPEQLRLMIKLGTTQGITGSMGKTNPTPKDDPQTTPGTGPYPDQQPIPANKDDLFVF
jgi:uncharacterized protein YegL